MRRVLLIVSIDTEEDNWHRSRQDVTCENIAELPRQAAFLDRLGVRPTYFTSYQVARDPRAADVVRQLRAGGAEIAAHLHPWNTPPLTEPFTARNSMLKNLPASLQLAKLECLTAALEESCGVQPRAFRAGRYGFGRDTVAALLRCAYQVDSSVTPFVSWEKLDDGPTFTSAPLDIYRLAPDRDVNEPVEKGELIEVPLSCGFAQRPFRAWARLYRALDVPGLRRLRGLCRRIVLSPELASAAEMLTLSRRLLDSGVQHLHLSWHSPSLKPGLSPFTATTADVARLYATVEEYLRRLSRITPLSFVTVSQAAASRTAAEVATC